MQDIHSAFTNTENAVHYLSHLSTPLTEMEIAQLTVLHQKAETSWSAGVIARFLGKSELEQWLNAMNVEHRSHPLILREIAIYSELSVQARFALAEAHPYYLPEDNDSAIALSEDDAYYRFSQETLIWAKASLMAIHEGQTPYTADKAFTVEEAHVIARCARIAALRYDDNTGLLLSTLLRLTSFAPGSAKTLPSQSLAIALGHAIQAYPLPETLQTLTEVTQNIRHAGVKKKLERNLKPAQRALAERPELALKMSAQLKAGKKSTTLLANCLEAGYLQDSSYAWSTWCEQLQNSEAGRKLTQNLVWLAHPVEGEPFTFMTGKHGFSDAQGNLLAEPAGSIIRLWHPLHTDVEERKRWQERIRMQQIQQPLRQVFRETGYALNADSFAGYWLSLSPFTGLARKEGWRLHDGYIERRFGTWRVQLTVDANLYPGVSGEGKTGELTLYESTASVVSLATLPPVIASEILRAVDLLVSVAALSINEDDADSRLGVHAIIQKRRDILTQLFEAEIARGVLVLDTHHARAGDHAIHLGTAIENHNGEIVYTSNPVPTPEVTDILLQRLVRAIQGWFR